MSACRDLQSRNRAVHTELVGKTRLSPFPHIQRPGRVSPSCERPPSALRCCPASGSGASSAPEESSLWPPHSLQERTRGDAAFLSVSLLLHFLSSSTHLRCLWTSWWPPARWFPTKTKSVNLKMFLFIYFFLFHCACMCQLSVFNGGEWRLGHLLTDDFVTHCKKGKYDW